jgi:type I restriction-modification system DNA methylase subunit
VTRRLGTEITTLIERSYQHFGGWGDAFTTSLALIEHALLQHEEEYLAIAKALPRLALDTAVKIYAHLSRMYADYVLGDILGPVYMAVGSRSKASAFGQYFTPPDLCDLMAQVTLGDIPTAIRQAQAEERKLTIHDPCVGSGAMLLAAKRSIVQQAGLAGLDQFRFSGQDNDPLCVRMAKIQLTLTDYRYMGNLLITKAYGLRSNTQRGK